MCAIASPEPRELFEIHFDRSEDLRTLLEDIHPLTGAL